MLSARSGSSHFVNLNPAAPSPGGRRYVYSASDNRSVLEYSVWHGDRCLPLRLHFHEQHQLTSVLSGRYRFVIGDQIVTAQAGECVFIPARQPHANVPHDQPDTTIVNAYIPVDQWKFSASGVVLFPMRGNWRARGALRSEDVAAGLDMRRAMIEVTHDPVQKMTLDLLSGRGGIGEIASAIGVSREGFTRQFTRQFGMSPHAYRLMQRLNEARVLLRHGESLAIIAAETGFADQSHLGRQFRRAFGTTPGAYRDAYF